MSDQISGSLSKIFVDLRAYAAKASVDTDDQLNISAVSEAVLKDSNGILRSILKRSDNLNILTENTNSWLENSSNWLKTINETLSKSFALLLRKQILDNDLPGTQTKAAAGGLISELVRRTNNVAAPALKIAKDSADNISTAVKKQNENSEFSVRALNNLGKDYASALTLIQEQSLRAAETSSLGTMSTGSGGDITNNVSFAGAAIGSSNLNVATLLALASIPGLGKRLAKVIVDMNAVFMSLSVPPNAEEAIQARALALNSFGSILNSIQNIKFTKILKSFITLRLFGKMLTTEMAKLTTTLMQSVQNSFSGLDKLTGSGADKRKESIGNLVSSLSRTPLQLFDALKAISETSMKDLVITSLTFKFLSGHISKNLAEGIENLYLGFGIDDTEDEVVTAVGAALQRIGNIFEGFANLPIIRVIFTASFFDKAIDALEKIKIGDGLRSLNKQLMPITKTKLLDNIVAFSEFINVFAKLPLIRFSINLEILNIISTSLNKIDPKKFELTKLNLIFKQVSAQLLKKTDDFARFINVFAKVPMLKFILNLHGLKKIGDALIKLDPNKFDLSKLYLIFKKVTKPLLDKTKEFADFINITSKIPFLKFTKNILFIQKLGELLARIDPNKFDLSKLYLIFKKVTKPLLDKTKEFARFVNLFAKIPFLKFTKNILFIDKLGAAIAKIDHKKFDLKRLHSIFSKVTKPLLDKTKEFASFIHIIAKLPLIRFLISLKLFPLIKKAIEKVDPTAIDFSRLESVFSKITPKLKKSILGFKDVIDAIADLKLVRFTAGMLAMNVVGVSSLLLAQTFGRIPQRLWQGVLDGAAALALMFEELGKVKLSQIAKAGLIALGAVTTIGALAIAIKAFTIVSVGDLAKAGVAIAGFMGIMWGLSKMDKIINKIPVKKLIGISLALITFGGGLIALGLGLRSMPGIEAVGVAIAALTTIGIAGVILGKIVGSMILASVAIAALGLSLIPLGIGLSSLPGVEAVGVAALALTALGIAGGIFGSFAPVIALGAGVLALLGLALIPLGLGLRSMPGIEAVSVAALALTALGIAGGIFGSFAPVIALGAGVLALLGLAFLPLAKGLQMMGEVSWSNLPSFKDLFGFLSGLALGVLPLAIASPFMIAGGLAMLPLALGLRALSTGIDFDAIKEAGNAIGILVSGSRWLMFAAAGMAIGGLAMLPLSLGLKALSWAVDPESFAALTDFLVNLNFISREVSFLGLLKMALGLAAVGLALIPLALAGAGLAVIGKVFDKIGELGDKLKDMAAATLENVKNFVNGAVDGIKKIGKAASEVRDAAVEKVAGAATSALGLDKKQKEMAEGLPDQVIVKQIAAGEITKEEGIAQLKALAAEKRKAAKDEDKAWGTDDDKVARLEQEALLLEKIADPGRLEKSIERYNVPVKDSQPAPPARFETKEKLDGQMLNELGAAGAGSITVINQGATVNAPSNTTHSTTNTTGGGPIITGSASGSLGY